jgi:hypothetical protein
MKLSTLFSLVAMTATLAACGGGGDAPAVTQPAGGPAAGSPASPPVTNPDVVDKYVGTWISCVPNAAGTSSNKDTTVITKSSATSMILDYKFEDFTNATCSGTATGTPMTARDKNDFKGTKAIGADTVDKFEQTDLLNSLPIYKQILLIKGNKFIFGAGFAAKDADGYPVALDPEIYAATKQ